jgi:hypothetical protein
MSLVIKTEKCSVHTDCPNAFYLESATCSTCGIKIDTDLEFNWSELPLSFPCHNCGDSADVSEADAYSELRMW